MANIRVDSSVTVFDGLALSFKSPADCSQVTGLIVYYPNGANTASKVFQFTDAHGQNVGNINHLFAANVIVKVILSVEEAKAYVQNADTNSYLEGRLDAKLDKSGGTMGGVLVAQNNSGYSTKQVRNIFLIADGASLPSGASGDICLVYTP